MITVTDPLFASLMTIPSQVRSLVTASHSDGVRLSFLSTDLLDINHHFHCFDVSIYVSRTGSLFLSGFQVLFFMKLCSSQLYSSSLLVYWS